nr:peroxisomal membrane protein 11C isoform X2 [Manis javanica]
MAALSGLVSALESYRGRDRLIRTLSYCCQLVGGALVVRCPARSDVGTRLLELSSQLSRCRTVLRLFDDAAMFIYTKQYGLGAEEEDIFVRCVSVLGNLADQLYYPCEHMAWAADAKILSVDSARWWTLSTAFWGLSLLLGIARTLRIISHLKTLTSILSAKSFLLCKGDTHRSWGLGRGHLWRPWQHPPGPGRRQHTGAWTEVTDVVAFPRVPERCWRFISKHPLIK